MDSNAQRGSAMLCQARDKFEMLLGAFDKPSSTGPPASLQELRRRRAVILLQKGFNKACVED